MEQYLVEKVEAETYGLKKVANFFKIPLDKTTYLWYNISVREITVTASKPLVESVCGNSLQKEREVHTMLHKDLFNEPRDAFYWVERVLHEHKDYYMSKEEIYAQIPTNREGVCIVTISAMENALRNLARMGHINIEYHLGRRYFNYREERKRYD